MTEIIEVSEDPQEIVEVITTETEIIEVIDVGPVGPPGNVATFSFSKPAFLLAPYTTPFLFPVPFDSVIDSVLLSVGTAPVGANLVLDILKNGTTIYTDDVGKPTILAGTRFGSGGVGSPVPATFIAPTDYISIQIEQVGTTNPGADLLVLLSLKRSG